MRIDAPAIVYLPFRSELSLAHLSHACTGRRVHIMSQRIVHSRSRIVDQIVDVPVPQVLEQILIE